LGGSAAIGLGLRTIYSTIRGKFRLGTLFREKNKTRKGSLLKLNCKGTTSEISDGKWPVPIAACMKPARCRGVIGYDPAFSTNRAHECAACRSWIQDGCATAGNENAKSHTEKPIT
jgi:hypothetical protein